MNQQDENQRLIDHVAEQLGELAKLDQVRGRKVIVAISGGPDSVAMLDLAVHLADRCGLTVRAAHVDHAIRPDSDQDADFVRQLCDRLAVPLDLARIDVPAEAQSDSVGLEEAARNARRSFFAHCIEKSGFGAVLTGHHLDDNVETVLHNLFRGTGLRGLAGIGPIVSLPGGGWLARPLLELTRQQLLEYLESRQLDWRTDPTNADTRLTRNFIRHELLPLVRERLNCQADQAVIRAAQACDQAANLLDSMTGPILKEATLEKTDQSVCLDLASLKPLPVAMLIWCFQRAITEMSGHLQQVGQVHYRDLVDLIKADQGNRRIQMPGLSAHRQGDRVLLVSRPSEEGAPLTACDQPIPLDPGRTELFGQASVEIDLLPIDAPIVSDYQSAPVQGVELLDADCLRGQLKARPRQDGDRFVPLGAPGSQSVSDFLTNARLGPGQRGRVCCLLDDDGIVYLAPLRIADRVKLTDQTRRVMRIQWNG